MEAAQHSVDGASQRGTVLQACAEQCAPSPNNGNAGRHTLTLWTQKRDGAGTSQQDLHPAPSACDAGRFQQATARPRVRDSDEAMSLHGFSG